MNINDYIKKKSQSDYYAQQAAPQDNQAATQENNTSPHNGYASNSYYAPQGNNGAQQGCNTTQANTAQGGNTATQGPEESTQQLLDKYGNMNEEQLMQEMFRNASASRANGTLNDSMLDDFYNNACGYLTPEQSERMKELIRELKK